MKRLLLLYPPYKLYHTVPPLGLTYLASYVQKANPQMVIKLIDYNVECSVLDFYKRDLKMDLEPFDIIAISFMSPMVNEALYLAKIGNTLRKKVIVGGYHASALPDEVLSSGFVDIVVRGEGEQTLSQLCDAWNNGGDLEKLRGISFMEDGKVRHNPDQAFIQNIDEIPFPARDLLELSRYKVRYPGLDLDKPMVNIIGSRGCPNHCIFCASSVVWKRQTRFRSPENIVREIESVIHDFGIRQFNFNDDTFTIRKDNVMRLCDLIIEKDLDIEWACSTRVTSSDKDLLKTMKESGCTRVGFGIESANPRVLKNIKKGITIENASKAIRNAQEVGLETIAYFLVGNPGENRQSVKDNIDFILDNNLDSFPGVVEPLPGTELYEIAKRNDWLRPFDWSELLKAEDRTVMRTEELSHEEVETLTIVSKIVLNRARKGILYGLGSLLYHIINRPDRARRILSETFGYYASPTKWSEV